MDIVNFNNDSFKRQMKGLGVGRVNTKKMLDGSTDMIPLFKNRELLITEDNMVQCYFNEVQIKELANLISTKAYQQIFTNGRVKYPFSAEEGFGIERTRFYKSEEENYNK